jgi:hypothetical protein
MRVGTRVQRYEVVGTRVSNCEQIIEHHGPQGTVIAYDDPDEGCEREGRRATTTIRWDDGRLEAIRADDEHADWCLDDVTPRLFVNVYLWDRSYGGPEEGGWWFDTYAPDPDHCTRHATEAEAEAWSESMLDWCQAQNAERHDPYSSISDGHYVVRLEAWPPQEEPACRPHYC